MEVNLISSIHILYLFVPSTRPHNPPHSVSSFDFFLYNTTTTAQDFFQLLREITICHPPMHLFRVLILYCITIIVIIKQIHTAT